MAIQCDYYALWFESFKLSSTAGHKLPIQLRIKCGQKLPPEISEICEARGVDAFHLLTRCNTDYQIKYPVGTQFLLEAKITDRKGGGVFFHAPYNWDAKEIIKSSR